ncbi:hypothetical protein Y032_0003g1644 [Ancylostoma ceylanicum]|uniref:Uncharacterized protein n=1 Tax=Ancylostoma ceylanicum TaxID=53326 RepID=A0A016VZ29_9BILA|nr:hypothetical protein Y032_0003g1644 [Ancylostoma ceylanicum]
MCNVHILISIQKLCGEGYSSPHFPYRIFTYLGSKEDNNSQSSDSYRLLLDQTISLAIFKTSSRLLIVDLW